MKKAESSKIILPSCAVGTWGWGKGLNGAGLVFGSVPKKTDLKNCYDKCVDKGLKLFDTAAVYGMGSSEKLLGEFSQNDDIIISTKFSPTKFKPSSAIEKTLDKSLKRLRRSSVDIYWLHNTLNLEDNLKVCLELLKSGKIKNLGLSNCTLEDVVFTEKILEKNGFKLFGVQNHYSLLYGFSESTGIIEHCLQNDLKFFAYMILEQGILAGRKSFSGFSRRKSAYSPETIKKISPLINTLKEIGEAQGISIAQTVTAHSVSKGLLPIVGVRNEVQAGELAKAVKIRLTEEQIQSIEKEAKKIKVEVKAAWE